MIFPESEHPKCGTEVRELLKKKRKREARYYALKRLLDIVFSALLLVFLALPMLGIALAVCMSSRGGALFRQVRVGKNGREFLCLKFRTMYESAPHDRPSGEMRDGRYITPIGRFLRRTSLDELPQLWNVLRGEMSLVGPRPIIPCEREIHELRRRSGVDRLRPGMTGLAQIRGRDLLPDREKARLDTRYANNASIFGDFRIMGETIFGVLLPYRATHFQMK